MIKKKLSYKDKARKNVPANALFDETTTHIFVEENGQVIEKKFCTYCNDWHPLKEFYYHKHSFDKLNCWCKPCMKKQHKLHIEECKRNKEKKHRNTTTSNNTVVEVWVVNVSA